jgi:hypothetical protein
MNVVMVTPAEVINVFTQMIKLYVGEQRADAPEDDGELQQSTIMHVYNIFSAVANTLQTLNFACNFILYCVVNVHFRRMLRQLVVMFGCCSSCCRGEHAGDANGSYSPTSNVRRTAPHRKIDGGRSMVEMTAVSSVMEEKPVRAPQMAQPTRNLLTPNYIP